MASIVIRAAEKEDVPVVSGLIRALAEFENLAPPDTEAQARFLRDGWETNPPRFRAYLTEVDGAPAGYAITFYTYSSFLAKPTLYIEDIFILPEHRSKGVGNKLFQYLHDLAQTESCGRMEWVVLDWNTGAQRFYQRLGASHQTEWQNYRITF